MEKYENLDLNDTLFYGSNRKQIDQGIIFQAIILTVSFRFVEIAIT